ncbi:MAG: hypothetical protein KC766_12105 [Myxococcales bacterium]|nr:hypothetical protein [Myxococcales bacterium]
MRRGTGLSGVTSASAALIAVCLAGNAGAQTGGAPSTTPPPEEAAPARAKRAVEFSAGAKALLGGSLWGTPENIPGGYEGLGFAGSAGGFAYGGAGYFEARFIEYLGLEFDIGFGHTKLGRTVTYNGTVDVDESVEMSETRVGLLFKGVIPTPFGRFWLGLGPLKVFSGDPDAQLEGATFPDGFIQAKAKDSTMLDMGLGLVIHAGDVIEIPVELRAAKNLSQEADWDQRVKLQQTGTQVTGYEVTAQSSWDFRLGFGIGARF